MAKKVPAGIAKRQREIDAKKARAEKRADQPSTRLNKKIAKASWYIRRGLPVPAEKGE